MDFVKNPWHKGTLTSSTTPTSRLDEALVRLLPHRLLPQLRCTGKRYDPHQLLVGDGKNMRHIKIPLTAGDFDKKAIGTLIKKAVQYDNR